jgi:sodium/potassium-transporting ATPase subunit alpha
LTKSDVIYIRSGDKIPADCVLFATTDLKVDNSSLTGEAEAQERYKVNEHQNPLEASNLVFNGTLAVNGIFSE